MGVPAQCYPLVGWPGVLRIKVQLENILEERENGTSTPFPLPNAGQQATSPQGILGSRILRRTRSVGMSSMHKYKLQCLLVRQPYTRADPQPALRQSRFDDAPQSHVAMSMHSRAAQPFSDATMQPAPCCATSRGHGTDFATGQKAQRH
ncbi:hypothetical protein E4U59_007654 [Claviceps monticola]|nr:hypothetical protein E4U59_007654 [Claviceps monticola]